MYMDNCFPGKALWKWNNSLRLRALYGINFRVTFPEKVHEVLYGVHCPVPITITQLTQTTVISSKSEFNLK